MKVVDDFFSHPNYKGNANKISKYAKYATHVNGPLAWGSPLGLPKFSPELQFKP
jgi:hypothetical protein